MTPVDSQPNPTDSLFDSTALAEYDGIITESGATLGFELVQEYLRNLDEIRNKITHATREKNHGDLELTYHSLKSSSALVGAQKISNLARHLEAQVEKDQSSDFSTANKELFLAMDQTRLELEKFISSKSK